MFYKVVTQVVLPDADLLYGDFTWTSRFGSIFGKGWCSGFGPEGVQDVLGCSHQHRPLSGIMIQFSRETSVTGQPELDV